MAATNSTCNKLIPNIVENYDVDKVVWQPAGNPQVSEFLVNCIYSAVVKEVWGDRAVMLVALLNTENKRFTVEVR
ncbi:hypothetical protein D3C86_1192530 [compost metagenome]